MKHDVLIQAIIYLLAMIAVVPISKRLGLGAVLGYLISGALLGPSGAGLIDGGESGASHLSELGVIMMLFLIGIEVSPRLLWQMRGPLFGLGGLQVAGTTLIFGALAVATGSPVPTAWAIGMILSLSSTAIVLQTLAERGFSKSPAGERSFAILLFQDIAVIPMLAVFPLLAPGKAEAAGRPGWQQGLIVLGAIVLLIASGRYLVRPLFRQLARLNLRETFTAAALLLVLATTALMTRVGLSPALGAFLAGVVLADSEFRHQIEADLEPFKGLLLGLFFISVGSGIDLAIPVSRPFAVASIVSCLVVLKGALVFGLGKVFKMKTADAFLLGASLAQGGEFAFVLLGIAADQGILRGPNAQLLTSSVALSMAVAPLVIAAAIRFGLPLLQAKGAERSPDLVEDKDSAALVVGIGRFGQVIVRLLRANGFRTTVLDYDGEQVDVMSRFGFKTYFGDGARPEVLRAAGIEKVGILVLAIDDQDNAVKITESVRAEHPHVKIFARAFDRVHAYKLLNAGAQSAVIETGGSAVDLGSEVLHELGFSALRSYRQGAWFRRHNNRVIRELAPLYGNTERAVFVRESRQRSEMLETLLNQEAGRGREHEDRGWDSGPYA